MAAPKFKKGDSVLLVSRMTPELNGPYKVKSVLVSGIEWTLINQRDGEPVSVAYELEGLGGEFWAEHALAFEGGC